MSRQPFLRFFAILLAIIAALTCATNAGVPQAVWRADQSMMTSAIGLLFLMAVARIGFSAWHGGDWRSVEFGHLAVRLSVLCGLFGTSLGLSLQAHSLATEGVAALGALSTSLYTTAAGIVSAALLEILTYNLEASCDV
jgi:drug/metabolite transporter (DMT)-like permease